MSEITAVAFFRDANQTLRNLFDRRRYLSSARTMVLSTCTCTSTSTSSGAEKGGRRWLPTEVRGGLFGCGRHLECACYFLFLTLAIFHNSFADDSTSKVREGIKLYSAEQYEEASKAFAAANESLERAKSDRAAVAAFDEACALHRKGDLELARDRYLKAGLSQDKSIATSAHFNLGVIASDAARKLAGEKPETVPAEKRKEVIGELTKSIDSYRHCLELDPKYVPARRNLELLRQWIKYYNDRWREADLQKRRDETNLVQFLEYLVQAQLALRETTSSFKASTSPNAFAEMKRLQSELRDEIPFLKDKIDSELRPKEEDDKAGNAKSKSASGDEELERGIALLNGWADESSSKMGSAEGLLSKRDSAGATEKQKLASDQLDQIWDAVVPFHPLLIKELSEQTQIAKQLAPEAVRDAPKGDEAKEESSKAGGEKNEVVDEPGQQPQSLIVNEKDWTDLLARQEIALRKTRLLGPKAESELVQVESQPKPDEAATNDATKGDPAEVGEALMGAEQKVDPEVIKAGYQKAIELAPKAVQEMEAAVKQLGKRDREQASNHAEEARRILQEIHDAQPKQSQQDQKDQEKQQDKNEQQEKKEGEQKNEDKEKEKKDSKDEQDKQGDKDKEKKEEKKSSEEDQKDKGKKEEQRQEPKVSQNRIEEALRRVREREQEKRERDRELKARVMGRVPVDKDW
jgi:Ca-activated chloride channel homolog